MIRVKSKQAGFRRFGIAHSEKAVEYPDGKFTPEQLAILKAEPMLIVEIVGESLPPLPADHLTDAAPYPDKPVESGNEPAKTGKKGKR
jgi:hypothetical protein